MAPIFFSSMQKGQRDLYRKSSRGAGTDTVNGEGAAFQSGTPQRLFQFNPRHPYIPYDVTADGQRFMVSNLIEEPGAMPITVVVNWTASLNTEAEG